MTYCWVLSSWISLARRTVSTWPHSSQSQRSRLKVGSLKRFILQGKMPDFTWNTALASKTFLLSKYGLLSNSPSQFSFSFDISFISFINFCLLCCLKASLTLSRRTLQRYFGPIYQRKTTFFFSKNHNSRIFHGRMKSKTVLNRHMSEHFKTVSLFVLW